MMIDRWADISPDEVYRYQLNQIWNIAGKKMLWIMLNPSTADAREDDPTVRRCRSYAIRWGYGGMVIVNLFAFRTPYPSQLKSVTDPVGPKNRDAFDRALKEIQDHNRDWDAPEDDEILVVCAWGSGGGMMGQDETVLGWLEHGEFNCRITALAITKAGLPSHPLYLKSDLKPVPYEGRKA